MTHDETFTKFCKPELDEIKGTQLEIVGILKGKNGGIGLCERVRKLEVVVDPGAALFLVGLCERVRKLEASYKVMIGAISLAGGAVVIEIVSLVFRHFAK